MTSDDSTCIFLKIANRGFLTHHLIHQLPRTCLSSCFGFEPSKRRPFPFKTRVIWVPGNYTFLKQGHSSHLWIVFHALMLREDAEQIMNHETNRAARKPSGSTALDQCARMPSLHLASSAFRNFRKGEKSGLCLQIYHTTAVSTQTKRNSTINHRFVPWILGW